MVSKTGGTGFFITDEFIYQAEGCESGAIPTAKIASRSLSFTACRIDSAVITDGSTRQQKASSWLTLEGRRARSGRLFGRLPFCQG